MAPLPARRQRGSCRHNPPAHRTPPFSGFHKAPGKSHFRCSRWDIPELHHCFSGKRVPPFKRYMTKQAFCSPFSAKHSEKASLGSLLRSLFGQRQPQGCLFAFYPLPPTAVCSSRSPSSCPSLPLLLPHRPFPKQPRSPLILSIIKAHSHG